MKLARLSSTALIATAIVLGTASCVTQQRSSSNEPDLTSSGEELGKLMDKAFKNRSVHVAQDPSRIELNAAKRPTYSEAELKKHIFPLMQELDCISVEPRPCGHVYPQHPQGAFELCNLTHIEQIKDDGKLISGPNIGWHGAGRHMGVFIGIRVVGNRFTNEEAYYRFRIYMNAYHVKDPATEFKTAINPNLVHALRGYCTGQPNQIPGGDSYDEDCRCQQGKEICHIWKDGKIVGDREGSGRLCRP